MIIGIKAYQTFVRKTKQQRILLAFFHKIIFSIQIMHISRKIVNKRATCANTKSNRYHYINNLKFRGTHEIYKFLTSPSHYHYKYFPPIPKAGKIRKENSYTEGENEEKLKFEFRQRCTKLNRSYQIFRCKIFCLISVNILLKFRFSSQISINILLGFRFSLKYQLLFCCKFVSAVKFVNI